MKLRFHLQVRTFDSTLFFQVYRSQLPECHRNTLKCFHNALFSLYSVNCWPSENGTGGCDVNIEYELQNEDLELLDVIISIPIP